jgi:hypothetical protein
MAVNKISVEEVKIFSALQKRLLAMKTFSE